MTTWPRCLSATSRHHASCTLDVSIFMPMFWVTQHPTITPIRSPPSSYPLADTIIYRIFIMLLSFIPASCKWPHPGYSGNLEMTRLWIFIIIIIMYCVLLYYATCAPLQIIDKLYGSSLSLRCARSYNIPERRIEDFNPGCVLQWCQPMT